MMCHLASSPAPHTQQRGAGTQPQASRCSEVVRLDLLRAWSTDSLGGWPSGGGMKLIVLWNRAEASPRCAIVPGFFFG